MKFNDMLLGALMAALGIGIALHAQTFPVMAGMQYGPEFFPTIIGAGIALCGFGLIGKSALSTPPAERTRLVTLPDWMQDRVNIMRALGVPAAVVFYILAAPHLGFLLTMFLTTFGLLALLGNPIPLSTLIALILPAILHLSFSMGLRVPLPRGIIEKLLF